MFGLIAVATALLASIGSGFWIRRQPGGRAAWMALAVGALGLAATSAVTYLSPTASGARWLATATLLVLIVAVALAAVPDGRPIRAVDDGIDLIRGICIVAFCGWALLLRQLDRTTDTATAVLAATIVLAAAFFWVQLLLAPSWTRFPVTLPATLTVPSIAVALVAHPASLPVSGTVGTQEVAWLALAAVLACASIFGSLRMTGSWHGRWGFARRFRNVLVLDSISIFVAIAVAVASLDRRLPPVVTFVWLAALAGLFVARCVRANSVIDTLETSVATRNALLRMPVQAVGVTTDIELKALLTHLAELTARTIGTTRAEIYLDPTPEPALASEAVSWGFSAAEWDLIHGFPYPGQSRSDEQPAIIQSQAAELSLAGRQAWSAAGKDEFLSVPILSGQRALGRIELWSPSEPVQAARPNLALAADIGREAGEIIQHALLIMATRDEVVQAQMLLAVSEAFSRGARLEDCLQSMAQRLVNHAGADRITIGIVDHDFLELHIAADIRTLQTERPALQGTRVPLSEWISYGPLSRRREPIAYLRSASDTPDQFRSLLEDHNAESYLAIPGYADGQLAIIIQIMSRSHELVQSPAVREIWRSIATQIQLGIESVSMFETSQRRERLEVMRRHINESLQSGQDLAETYDAVAHLFRELPGIHGATILSRVAGSTTFRIEAEWTIAPIVCDPVGMLHDDSSYVILRDFEAEMEPRLRWIGQPGIEPEQRQRMEFDAIGSQLAIPLRVEHALVGAFLLYSHKRERIASDTIDLARQLSATLALVVKTLAVRQGEADRQEEQSLKLRMLQAASSDQDPYAALTAVATAGIGFAGAESINIAFIDAEAQGMVIAADVTIPEWPGVEEPGTRLSFAGESVQKRAFLELRPYMFSSADEHLGPHELMDTEEYGAHSWICAPLRVGGQALGLLQVLSRQPNAFDERRLQLWDEVAQQVSLVISTLQISFDNRRLSRHQRLVTAINEAGATSASVHDAYVTLANLGLDLPGVESCVVYLWHAEDGLLEVGYEATVEGRPARHEAGKRFTPDSWIDGDQPVRPREAAHLYRDNPDVTAAERAHMDLCDAGRLAAFMLLDEGVVHGVIDFAARDGSPFPAETIELGNVMAANAAAVVRNLRAREDGRQSEIEQNVALRLSRAATATHSLDEMYAEIAVGFRELTGARSAEVHTFGSDRLTTRLSGLDNDPAWAQTRLVGDTWPFNNWSIEETIVASSQPTVIRTADDPRLNAVLREHLQTQGTQSLMLVPLTYGVDAIGYVALHSEAPCQFISSMVRSAATLASQAALAVQHCRKQAEDARAGEDRTLLLRITHAATSSLDLTTVLRDIAEASLDIGQTESCVIELYDATTNELAIGGISRVDDWVLETSFVGTRRAFGTWSVDDRLRNAGVIRIDTLADPSLTEVMRSDMGRFGTQSAVEIALVSGGQLLGAYHLFSRQANAYGERDVWLVSEIGNRIVSAIQNAQMLETEHQVSMERQRLLQISEAATRTLNLDEVLREIASASIGLAGAESCHIEFVDHERDEFVGAAYATVLDWNNGDHDIIGRRCPIGNWTIDHASISQRAPVSIGTVDDPRVIGQLRADMEEYGSQSILVIPVWLEDRCEAVLNFYSRKAHAFTNTRQTIAHTLATQAANAIQNARTHERERARRRDQEALLSVTAAATSSLDLTEAMTAVCNVLREIAHAESAIVGINRPDQGAFEIAAQVSVADWAIASEPGSTYPAGANQISRRVLADPRAFAVDRFSEDEELRLFIIENRLGIESLAVAPLWLNDICLGYLGLLDRKAGLASQHILRFIDNAAAMVGLALSNGLKWRDQERQASDRAAIVAVGRAAVSDADLPAKLAAIGEACLDLQRVGCASFLRWESDTQDLVLLADVGQPEWDPMAEAGTRYPIAPDSPYRRFMESMDGVTYALSEPDLHPELRADLLDAEAQAAAVFPLRAGEEFTGFASFFAKEPFRFDEAFMRVGREVATQTALAMRAADLLDSTRRYAQEQASLLAVNRAVMSATDRSITDVLDRISYETMELVGSECCEIEVLMPDMSATELVSQVMVNGWVGQTSGPGLRLPLAQWPTTRQVIDTRTAVILDPATAVLTEFERDGLFAHGTKSGLVAPMELDGRPLGIISFYSRQPHAFTPDHVRMATEFGSLAALAIDRVRTHMALSEQATADALTGLLNRRAILDRLDHQIAIGERTSDAVSVLLIDLNGFKHVNDTFGHLAGDAVLIEIARFLELSLRPADLVGRYGGDEFLAVLPHTDIVQAISVRDRLMEQVRQFSITLADGAIVTPTFAVGFAAYPAQGQTRTALIEMADRVMYESKPTVSGAGANRPHGISLVEVIELPR